MVKGNVAKQKENDVADLNEVKTALKSLKEEVECSPRSSEIVVAAKDASEKIKKRADYVCDGVDDHVQIGNAIADIAKTGGKILLSEGTFYFSRNGTVTIPSNIVIKGQGFSTVVEKKITTTGTFGTALFIFPEETKCSELRDMKVIHNKTVQGGSMNTAALVDINGSLCMVENVLMYRNFKRAKGYLIRNNGDFNNIVKCILISGTDAENETGIVSSGKNAIINMCKFGFKGSNKCAISVGGEGSIIEGCIVDESFMSINEEISIEEIEKYNSCTVSIGGENVKIVNNFMNGVRFGPTTAMHNNELSNNYIRCTVTHQGNSSGWWWWRIYATNSRITNNIFEVSQPNYANFYTHIAFMEFGNTTYNSQYSVIQNNTLIRTVGDDYPTGTYTIGVAQPTSEQIGCVVKDNICVPAIVEETTEITGE